MSEMTLEELNDLAANIREMKAIAPYTTSIEGAILLACARIAEQDAEIERLRKALEQAAEIVVRIGRDIYPDVTNQRYTCFDEWDDDNQCWGCGYTESPELAAYLRERDAVSSTDTRPPAHGVQSGVQEPEEGGQNA